MVSDDMKKFETIPAISVVIPTYNIENYIDQTLNSILNQTFKDYEVIVIDDCSTDKTVDVVKTFLPRFDGKLQIHRLKKNSSEDDSAPRNFGLGYSRGKYIFFLDGDDLITPDAFEKLYNAAEKFQADMVSTTRFYRFKDRGVIPEQNELILSDSKPNGIKEPTIVEDGVLKRAQMYVKEMIYEYIWNKLIRRDFLIEHDITFPKMLLREDSVFSFECYCLSKCVLIPDVLNLYRRTRIGSVTNSANSTAEKMTDDKIRKYINCTIIGAKEFYNFMQRIDEFKDEPKIQYDVIRHYIKVNFNWLITKVYSQISAEKVFQIFTEEFLKDPAGYAPAAAVIFNMANGK